MNQVPSPHERLVSCVLGSNEGSKDARTLISHFLDRLERARGHATSLDADLSDAARRLCETDIEMLGPLFETVVRRDERYEQGQYFTPRWLSERLATHVAAYAPTTVLDPAVGAGALLAAVAERIDARLIGCDRDPLCVRLAAAGLKARGVAATLRVADFLSRDEAELVDAIVCNPPYIRHHLLDAGLKKALAERYERAFGLRPSGLSSSYAYFFLEAARRLREGGVMVFLTPADFLDVRYGRVVKELLRDHLQLERIERFDPDELAFDGVLTTTAITVATKRSATSSYVIPFVDASRHGDEDAREVLSDELNTAGHWGLEFPSIHARHRALCVQRPRTLSDYVSVRRGIATGANGFFLMTDGEAQERGIESRFLTPVIASARDLPSGDLTTDAWQELRETNRRVWLLDTDEPLEALEGTPLFAYLASGKTEGVHERYNCRTRTPWYRVEQVKSPDIIVTYMNRGAIRFVRNETDARVMSVFLNMYVNDGVDVDALLDVLRSPETCTLIELAGRTYGGGLKKVEPRALLSVPMPEL